MSWRTNSNGNKFPTQSKMKLYYQVMVTHYPEGYDPYTVEYGPAETSMEAANRMLERAKAEFPMSKAHIETMYLESY
ncbi:MAG TPA: hypothetical protein VEP90_26240 [Methylomirabilota bacterium]|nr:hypothetical protein [Methylomirabilota bacterium]